MISLSGKGRTKSWEAHERDQQFGEDVSIEIGKSQRLHKGSDAEINKLCAMRPRLAKIIETVHISRYWKTLTLTAIEQQMVVVLIKRTHGRRNKFIDCQTAKV